MDKEVFISFHAPVNEQTAQHLLGASFNQINNGATKLVYLISTPGGHVSSGITIYNVLKGLPVPTVMHNVGNIDSIGNAVFLAGQTRLACPHSTFMFHGVGFDVQAYRFERKDLEERLDSIRADEGKIGGIISDESSLVSGKVNDLFVQASTKDANWALENGIVHAIEDVVIPNGAPVVQLVF